MKKSGNGLSGLGLALGFNPKTDCGRMIPRRNYVQEGVMLFTILVILVVVHTRTMRHKSIVTVIVVSLSFRIQDFFLSYSRITTKVGWLLVRPFVSTGRVSLGRP